jgi:hypothetical protein
MRRFLERKSRGQCQGVPIASLLAEAFWRCRGQIFVRRIPVRLRDVQTYKVLHYSINGGDVLKLLDLFHDLALNWPERYWIRIWILGD